MDIEQQIRSLAQSSYWQEIYNTSKNCSNIQIFNNVNNFSGVQYLFLYWLKVYSMLYDELYSLEWRNLDKQVIKDNDRCDAFLYYRRKEQEKRIRKNQKEERKNQPQNRPNMMKVFTGAKNPEEKK